jgi:hypothetical protein
MPNRLFEQRRIVNRREHHRAKVLGLACHEAAHAVVAASFGKTVECLTLDTFNYQGNCRWRPDQIWPALVTIAAGTAAERFTGRIRATEWAGGNDFEKFSDLARGDQALMADAEREARRRVERLWSRIEAIAIQLAELGTLQGDALTRALMPVRPSPSAPTRTRALDILISKPVRTIKNDRGLEIGEVWACRSGDDRWFEALTFRSDGSKKKRGRFSSEGEAAKAITSAATRKAA